MKGTGHEGSGHDLLKARDMKHIVTKHKSEVDIHNLVPTEIVIALKYAPFNQQAHSTKVFSVRTVILYRVKRIQSRMISNTPTAK